MRLFGRPGLFKCVHGILAMCFTVPVFPMTLLKAYDAAQSNDAQLRASRAALQAGQERVVQARAQLLPAVSASLTRNFNDLKTDSQDILGRPVSSREDYYSFNRSLSLRQPVFNVPRYVGYQQAFALVEQELANYEQDEQDLAVRLGSAYMQALLSAEQVRLSESQLTQYQALLSASRMALSAGTGTRTDIDEAQARVDMAQATLLEAKQQVLFARRQMEILVGQPVEELARLKPSALRDELTIAQDLQYWIDAAWSTSPEVKSLQARLRSADLEILKSKSAHAPTLDAVLQWSESGNDNISRLNARYNSKVAGLQLTIPLYQGGQVSSAVRQAVALREQVLASLEALRQDVELRVHREFRGVTEGALRIAALEQAERSAELALSSTVKSRVAGVRSQLDVLNAEQQLMTVKRDLAEAMFSYVLAQLRLHGLAGVSPRDNIARLNQVFVH